jgi:hypothetical protein
VAAGVLVGATLTGLPAWFGGSAVAAGSPAGAAATARALWGVVVGVATAASLPRDVGDWFGALGHPAADDNGGLTCCRTAHTSAMCEVSDWEAVDPAPLVEASGLLLLPEPEPGAVALVVLVPLLERAI